jgi:cell wall-associated NlpC family hydrolase
VEARVTIQRWQDWPERLDLFIRARERVPFAWGTNDCALFAADAVRAMTGVDVAQWARGKYRTQQGAARLLTKRGGLAALVDALLPAVPPLTAQRGDVVMFKGANGMQLGVCLGGQFVVTAERGLVVRPLTLATMAWRV